VVQTESPFASACAYSASASRRASIRTARASSVCSTTAGTGCQLSRLPVPGRKTEPFQLVADATDPEHQWQVARVFQQKLDGFAGAGGDVRDYARLFEMLTE
jgi:hypothetical protein